MVGIACRWGCLIEPNTAVTTFPTRHLHVGVHISPHWPVANDIVGERLYELQLAKIYIFDCVRCNICPPAHLHLQAIKPRKGDCDLSVDSYLSQQLAEYLSAVNMSNTDQYHDEGSNGDSKIPGAPGAVVVAEDPAAPSKDISSKRQSLSDLFTIVSVTHW